jgi:hypothetical protein
MNDKTIADELLALGNALNKVTAASSQRETFWNAHLQKKGEPMSDLKQAVARNKTADKLKRHPKFYQGSTLLHKAASNIEEALEFLNTESHLCDGECRRTMRDNFKDYEVYTKLQPKVELLRRLAKYFRSDLNI